MSGRRRRFSAEFKVEAAYWVINTGRPVAEVARELTLGDALLAGWVRAERARIEARIRTEVELAELLRLRKQVSELEKDNAFLGKVSAYFAANPPKRSDLL